MNRLVVTSAKMVTVLAVAAAFMPGSAGSTPSDTHLPDRSEYRAPPAITAPVIDGVSRDEAWSTAAWRPIDNVWLGDTFPDSDFSGRFKVVWDADRIYILVEIVDDILFDSHRDPLIQYWDDDCLEIFIDEDFSGGDHQYNHNAFAYHLSLDNQAIDIGTDRRAQSYNHHVDSRWRQTDRGITWEIAIDIYADDYVDGSAGNEPVHLYAGKIIGLMLAYCDNDGSELRENFIGSESVPYGKKDRGYIDAGLFGKLILVESP